MPTHVAIVMDGNGRWAAQHRLSRHDGHRAGIASVKAVVKGCLAKGIQVLSLFAFSSENWQRPQEEVSSLMTLFFDTLSTEVDLLEQQGVQLRFCGDKSRFIPELQQLMGLAEEKTRHLTNLILNICIDYGGRWDIVQAAKNMTKQVMSGTLSIDAINESLFASQLATHPLPPPDLIIRTSGEYRLSNFLLWQAAYSELFFTDVLWPDFREEHFDQAIEAYAQRERRFGLVEA